MGSRKKVPGTTKTEVLTRSLRRCCLCFGLEHDTERKKGQIAHLDRDPSNCAFDNLAWLCLDHHDEYDSRTSQSKGLAIREVKSYRDSLYDWVRENLNPSWQVVTMGALHDVPLLSVSRSIDPKLGIPVNGIELSDRDPQDEREAPWLYVHVYFKRSRYFGRVPDQGQKWLYIEANMRPALNLRIQVLAWNQRDVAEFMRVLRSSVGGYDLHGLQPGSEGIPYDAPAQELHAGDYLRIWQEGGEQRMLVSTFTATNAGISVHARMTRDVAASLADYLEASGFAS
ncbi:MAG: hypothetical protein ABIK79_03160 [Chloroflexota bacterium]